MARGRCGEQGSSRFRGAHVLQRDENGLEKCVACFLCAANCPSNCIYIEAAENTAEHRVSGAERYAKVYNIDYNRCIFCGYCVEACPTDAITHGHGFELATFNATNLIYRKEQMLAPRPAHMGANAYLIPPMLLAGAPGRSRRGVKQFCDLDFDRRRSSRAGVCASRAALVVSVSRASSVDGQPKC